MSDLVSIITPSYNSAEFIEHTIESVLSQSYENWEMFIIDDASMDASIDLVASYAEKDPRVKVLKLEKNNGVAAARNIGIEAAKGKYIAFLDSDDLWLPTKLEQQVRFMIEKRACLPTQLIS